MFTFAKIMFLRKFREFCRGGCRIYLVEDGHVVVCFVFVLYVVFLFIRANLKSRRSWSFLYLQLFRMGRWQTKSFQRSIHQNNNNNNYNNTSTFAERHKNENKNTNKNKPYKMWTEKVTAQNGNSNRRLHMVGRRVGPIHDSEAAQNQQLNMIEMLLV